MAEGTTAACAAEARAYVDCVALQTYTCSTSGRATFDKAACRAQTDAVDACERSDAATLPPPTKDAGTDG